MVAGSIPLAILVTLQRPLQMWLSLHRAQVLPARHSTVIDVAVAIVGTNASAYMLFSDGSLFVAGYNGQGQLSIGSTTGRIWSLCICPPTWIFPGTTQPISGVSGISVNGGSTGGNALVNIGPNCLTLATTLTGSWGRARLPMRIYLLKLLHLMANWGRAVRIRLP